MRAYTIYWVSSEEVSHLLPKSPLAANPRLGHRAKRIAAIAISATHVLLRQSLGFAPDARVLCLGLGWSLGHVLCSNAHILLRG